METCFRSPNSYPLYKGVFNMAGTFSIPDNGLFTFGIGFSRKPLSGFQNITRFKNSLEECIIFDTKGLLINDNDVISPSGETYKIYGVNAYFQKKITDPNNMTFFGIPIKIIGNSIYERITKDEYDIDMDTDIYVEGDAVYINRTFGISENGKYIIYTDQNSINYVRIKASSNIEGAFSLSRAYDFNDKTLISYRQSLGQVKNGTVVPDKKGSDDFMLSSGKIKISVCEGNRITFQMLEESGRSYKKVYSVNFKKSLEKEDYYIYFFVSDISMLTQVGVAFEQIDCSSDI